VRRDAAFIFFGSAWAERVPDPYLWLANWIGSVIYIRGFAFIARLQRFSLAVAPARLGFDIA